MLYIYSCDIISLYTNITHELGLNALKYWIDRERHLIPTRFSVEFIIGAAEFVLTNNNFLFDNFMYNQLIGTAMGTKFAPPYACLAIGFLEETKLYNELPVHFSPSYCDFLMKHFFRYNMDDGIIPWPKVLHIDILEQSLNTLDPKIEFTLEAAKEVNDVIKYQYINFLDIKIILHDSGEIETDMYYKSTNTHDYLDFNSHHPLHIKKNIPYVLAKRIIIFSSDFEKDKNNLDDLKEWLIKCNYPPKIIKKGFHNARLQGPAPKPKTDITLPLVTTHYGNYDLTNLVKTTNNLLKSSRDERIREVFGNSKTVLSLKQPPNLLRQLTRARFNSLPTDLKENGIFKCDNKRCKLCKLYIQECKTFTTSNNIEWEVRSRITCGSTNIIYFLKCISCEFKVTYTGKTNDLRSRMNNHTSACRLGNSSDQFDNHVYECCMQHNNAIDPYFQMFAFVKLREEKSLLTYEAHFHSKGFDTMN